MKEVGVGILGFGTVGAGVADGLLRNRAVMAERLGVDIVLRKIADLDITTDRGVAVDQDILTTDAQGVIADPSVQIVVETIGGTGIARTLVLAALNAGKAVVTANKKLLAEHGAEIFGTAAKNGVDIYFGASVGGGIPIIRSLRDGLVGNRVETIYGILNGTCNYILTEMERAGKSFDEVLRDAQKLGFAEADPTLDVDGFDTLHKAAILAALAYGFFPDVHALPVQGIRGVVGSRDIAEAKALGYRVKLLAVVKKDDAGLELRVAPTLVPESGMLGSVSGVFNAAMVKSDLDDWTLYYGRGAGRLPTASTVIGDIADVARALAAGTHRPFAVPVSATPVRVKSLGECRSKFYVRLALKDAPGSLAAATSAFAAHGVSIRSAVQRGAGEDGFATVVVLTHETARADLDAALADVSASGVSGAAPVSLGIEE